MAYNQITCPMCGSDKIEFRNSTYRCEQLLHTGDVCGFCLRYDDWDLVSRRVSSLEQNIAIKDNVIKALESHLADVGRVHFIANETIVESNGEPINIGDFLYWSDGRLCKAKRSDEPKSDIDPRPRPSPSFFSFEIDWSTFPYVQPVHEIESMPHAVKLERGQLINGYRIFGFGDSIIDNQDDLNYEEYTGGPCDHLRKYRYAYGRLDK